MRLPLIYKKGKKDLIEPISHEIRHAVSRRDGRFTARRWFISSWFCPDQKLHNLNFESGKWEETAQ
jgi:hypothetical protein